MPYLSSFSSVIPRNAPPEISCSLRTFRAASLISLGNLAWRCWMSCSVLHSLMSAAVAELSDAYKEPDKLMDGWIVFDIGCLVHHLRHHRYQKRCQKETYSAIIHFDIFQLPLFSFAFILLLNKTEIKGNVSAVNINNIINAS